MTRSVTRSSSTSSSIGQQAPSPTPGSDTASTEAADAASERGAAVVRGASREQALAGSGTATDDVPRSWSCVVCLETVHAGAAVVPLSCGCTAFHAACVVQWLQHGNRSCPCCRFKPPLIDREGYDPEDYSDYDNHSEASSFAEGHNCPYADAACFGWSRDEIEAARAAHTKSHEEWERAARAWQLRITKNAASRVRAVEAALDQASRRESRPPAHKARLPPSGAHTESQLDAAVTRYREGQHKLAERTEAHKAATQLHEQAAKASTKRRRKITQQHANRVRKIRRGAEAEEARAFEEYLTRLAASDKLVQPADKAQDKADAALDSAETGLERAATALAKTTGWSKLSASLAPTMPAELENCSGHFF